MNEQVDASLMIEKGQVVVVDYRLIDQSGDCLEQSDEASPMVYLHGHNNLMPGLERELQGKQQGDQLAVTLPPEQTYEHFSFLEQICHVISRGDLHRC